MRRGTRSVITRSVRFGAAVAIFTFALAIAGTAYAYTSASHGSTSVEMTAMLASERVEMTQPPPMALDDAVALYGGSSDAPVEERPIAESTVVPAPTATLVVAAAHAVAPTATPAPRAVEATPEPRVVASRATTYNAIVAAFPAGEGDRAYRVAMCESSGNAHANTGNGYYGLWQFDLSTWRSVGGAGLPSAASLEEQTARARMLYDRRGWSPWECA